MTRRRRQFYSNFSLEVVRMIRGQGLSLSEACRLMELGEVAVRRWVAQYDAESSGGAGVGKPLTVEQQRIRQLEMVLHAKTICRTRHFFQQSRPLVGAAIGAPTSVAASGLTRRTPAKAAWFAHSRIHRQQIFKDFIEVLSLRASAQ
jgi:transposase